MRGQAAGRTMLTITTENAEETERFAMELTARLRPGDVIACRGGMGAGKTAFARGLARGLGLTDGVSSPTFALVHEYTGGRLPLYHFDMYRVHGFDELYSTGFFDYLEQDGILFIEWSENVAGALPENVITLTMERTGENTRDIRVEGGPF